MGIGSLGCPHGTVSVYHLIRPNIGNVVHGVPSDRDLRSLYICPYLLPGFGLNKL